MSDDKNSIMSLMPENQQLHPIIGAADNHNLANGESSWYDPETIAKYGEATVISGALSLANSALSLGRWVGATDQQNYDIGETMKNLDSDLGQYYEENKTLVDTSAFIGTSLIPGLAGTKLYNVGSKALAAYMGADIGEGAAAAGGFLANKSSQLIGDAFKQMANSGSKFQFLDPHVAAGLALGVADDYAGGVAYMALASAALNQAPVFDGMDAEDMAVNALHVSVPFLGISAGLRAAGIFGKAKAALTGADTELNAYRKSTELSTFDNPSTQILAYAKDIAQRPDVAVKDGSLLEPTTIQRTTDEANRRAYEKMRVLALKVTGDDPVAARALIEDVTKMSATEQNGNLINLISYKPIAGEIQDNAAFAGRVLNRVGAGDVKTAEELQAMLKANKTLSEAEITDRALNALHDTGDTPIASGKLYASGKQSLAINRATGQVQDSFLPVLGDMLGTGQKMQVTPAGLVVGKRVYSSVLDSADEYSVLDVHRMDAEARYIYNMESPPKLFTDEDAWHLGDEIHKYDFPTQERALREGEMTWDEPVLIKHSDDYTKEAATPDELRVQIANNKMDAVAELKARGASISEIAQRLNISEDAAKDITLLRDNPKDVDLFRMQSSVTKTEHTGETVKPYLEPQHYIARYDAGSKQQAEFAKSTTLGNQYIALKEAAYQSSLAPLENLIADGIKNTAQLPNVTDINVGGATRMGAGGKLFSFANGAYRSVQAAMEMIGKWGYEVASARGVKTKQFLEPSFQKVGANPEALAEWNALSTRARRGTSLYKFVDLGADTKGALISKDAIEKVQMVAKEQGVELPTLPDVYEFGKKLRLFQNDEHIPINTLEVSDAVRAHVAANTERQLYKKTMMDAKGAPMDDRAGNFYVPPINYKDYPFYAFVHSEKLGDSGVSIITARTANELQENIAKVKATFPEYTVSTKAEKDMYFKMQAAYDYDAAITSTKIDSNLKAAGVQNEFAPPTTSTKSLNQFMEWHAMQETALVRDYVTARYGGEFAKIEALGQASDDAASASWDTSIANIMRNKDSNSWMDYRRTAMFVPKNNNQILQTMDDTITRATDGAWNSVKSVLAKMKYDRMKPEELQALVDEANAKAKANGIGTPYADGASLALANMQVDRNVARRFVGRANALLSNIMLGFDPFQALNNHLGSYVLNSPEITSVLRQINNDPQFADVQKLIMQKVPGTEIYQRSPGKLISSAISSFFSDEKGALLKKYQDLGLEMTPMQQLRSVVDDLTIQAGENTASISAKADKVFEWGRKWTGNNFAETFNRYISANIIDRITAPMVAQGVMSPAEAYTMMNTFVNRTHGNFIASQRPQIFQGVVGSAISLYQTYQWNLMQQLFRYVGDGEKSAFYTAMAVQGSLYGLNGMPAFNAMNNLIATARGNPDHHDMFDTISSIGGRDKAEWLLYGLGSNALGLINADLKSNLYSRGDINPRSWTILPTNPMDIPVVAQTAKMVGAIKDTFTRIGAGGDITSNVLQGIEHLGINRPLTGLAQIANGRSTTNQGLMLSAVDLTHASAFIRMLGGKPMDEAVALDAMYRNKTYAQEDKDRLDTLGSAIRSAVSEGKVPSQAQMDSFAANYGSIKGEGDPKRFQQFYTKEMLRADASVANALAEKNRTSAISRYMQTVMGNHALPTPASVDAANNASEASSNLNELGQVGQ